VGGHLPLRPQPKCLGGRVFPPPPPYNRRPWCTQAQCYGSQKFAARFTVKVVVSQKWCKTDTLLLHTTNRKYHGLSIRVISHDLECHSPVAGLVKRNSTNICATFRTVSTDTARRADPRRQLSFLFIDNEIQWVHKQQNTVSSN